MYPSALFDALKSHHKLASDAKVAKYLGLTSARISQMRNRTHALTPRQIVSYLESANKRGQVAALADPIRPVVEMYPIDHTASRHGAAVELLPTSSKWPRNRSIREYLQKVAGVYVFFDSQGRAIYVGKNTAGNLWAEMTSAFNRERSNHQAFFVDHPKVGKSFTPAWQQPRQPRKRVIKLCSTAMFFSAYEVSKPLIGVLEALLVRSFSNTLTNKKMEKFGNNRGESK